MTRVDHFSAHCPSNGKRSLIPIRGNWNYCAPMLERRKNFLERCGGMVFGRKDSALSDLDVSRMRDSLNTVEYLNAVRPILAIV